MTRSGQRRRSDRIHIGRPATLICGIAVLLMLVGDLGCTWGARGGTGQRTRFGGNLNLPFDFPTGSETRAARCDSETERIGTVDGEIACVPKSEPDSEDEADPSPENDSTLSSRDH